MSRARKIAPFISLALLAYVFSAAKRLWKSATTAGKYGLVAAIGGAIGLVIALIFRALK